MLVCFALPEEAKPFQKQRHLFPHVRVVVTGMGRQHTERALNMELARTAFPCVLTCGFAGGLNPAWKLNDVLFETDDPTLADRLARSGLKPAKFHCADRIAVTTAEKENLHRNTRADAVEMESASAHQLCRACRIPCATVRVISDTASEDMPLDFNILTTAENKLHFGRLALAILKSPRTIPALVRLQRQTAQAAEALSEALVRFMKQA